MLLALGLAGCGPEDTDDGWLTLLLQPESGTDPFNDPAAAFLYLQIHDGAGGILRERSFPLGGNYRVGNAPTGSPRYFLVEVQDAENAALARGVEGPFALEKDTHVTVTIVLEELP